MLITTSKKVYQTGDKIISAIISLVEAIIIYLVLTKAETSSLN